MAKRIMVDKYYHHDSRERGTELVRQFIIDKQLIITGGLVIDYALRLKGEKIYEDYEVPDYDIFSPNNASDASELFMILYENGFSNISLLPGLHPSTVKVYVYKDCIADLTFINKESFDKMASTALIYDDLLFRSPYFQYPDMHRALTYPYENEPRETINNRWIKDFERFIKLYKYYPVCKSIPPGGTGKSLNKRVTPVAGLEAVDYYLGTSYKRNGESVFLMNEKDRSEFLLECTGKIKNITKYKGFLELLPSREIVKLLNGETVTIINCQHKTSVQDGYVSANFCVIYCYSMFMITDEEIYNNAYCELLNLLAKAYEEGDTRYYPSIITYGEEVEGVEGEKVPQVHLKDSDDQETRNAEIAKLPFEFTYAGGPYDMNGDRE